MKHNTFKSVRGGLFAAVLVGFAMTSGLAAEGQVAIEGTVASVNEIVVTPVAGFDSLDLTLGATDQQVATINEKNNDPDGYTVTLVSANAATAASAQARLNGSDGENSQVYNYTMKYGVAAAEAAVLLDTAGSAVVSSTSAASDEAGDAKSLLISFTGASWKNADTYMDTLTLTIAAK